MCGIAGILSPGHGIDPGRLDRFTDSLAHRGPDGRGTWIGDGIGLGHRRLAILDLSEAGACPMEYRTPDGRVLRITYNGEVYDFLELRKELESLGHRFRTSTDTEIVAAAYAQWGKECQSRFNGMWAFAIWDESNRKLFLSRDRFGIKPLYYSVQDGEFVFASEIKAFVSLDGFRRVLDEEMAVRSLGSSQSAEGTSDRTLMRDLRRLLPGHCIEVGMDGHATIERWWDTLSRKIDVPSVRADRVDKFRQILLDAVAIRMRSDVPVGTCLSGGIDSTAVASCMAALHGGDCSRLERTPKDWRRAYVASFPGSSIDETEYAMKAVHHVGADPRIWSFESAEAISHLLQSVWSMEEVYPGIAVPVWCLYREMRKDRVVVSLDGHGGDELLGGYTWYLDWPMSQVNANLEADFHRNLLPSILRNYDRCSMAHGIEVRMPLMDWRLVTYAFSLSAEEKIGGGHTKRILRDAMEGIMPESIRNRRSKFGFNSPMIEWYNGGLVPKLSRWTSHPYWLESPWWNGPELRKQILAKSAARAWTMADWSESLEVWTRLNLTLWIRMFIDGEPLHMGAEA